MSSLGCWLVKASSRRRVLLDAKGSLSPAFHFGGVHSFVVGRRLGDFRPSRSFQFLDVAEGVDGAGAEGHCHCGRDQTAELFLDGHLNFFLMR